MRIGILTFHSVDNYGAVLQAFALQSYMASLGHDVGVIDYRPTYFHEKRKIVLRPDRVIGRFVMNMASKRFESFRKKHLHRTVECRALCDFETRLPTYDVIVAGSDQIWNPTVDRRMGVDQAYFVPWSAQSRVKKIAYAASFGEGDVQDCFRDAVASGLENFDAISVREDSGVRIVKELTGRNSAWVCDPVFLMGASWWRTMAQISKCRSNALFAYMPPGIDYIASIARMVGEKVVTTGWNVRSLWVRGVSYYNPDPLGWVRQIGTTSGVVTKSFHGLAFCILLHTPFVYWLPTNETPRNAERCLSILRRVGLEDRIVRLNSEFDVSVSSKLGSDINWSVVDEKLRNYVDESKAFLKQALLWR